MSTKTHNLSPEELEHLNDYLYNQFAFQRIGFSDPIKWSDGVGLSRIKKFPDGRASLYKIGIGQEEIQKDTTKKKVSISVSHGKEVMGGISLGSETGLSSPIDLSFRDDFTYDLQEKKFYYRNKVLTPIEVLAKVEEVHERPTKKVGGLFLRSRLWFWRKLLPGVIRLLDLLLIGLLWLISGERVTDNILKRLLGLHSEKAREGISSKRVQFEEVGTIDFFGYKAKRWSVVFYCGLHLLIFAIYILLQVEYEWLTKVLTNSFLVLCYVVVSFSITEALIPKFLKSIIGKITPELFGSIAFKSIKV